MNQKGSVNIVVIIVILILAGGAVYFMLTRDSGSEALQQGVIVGNENMPIQTPDTSPTADQSTTPLKTEVEVAAVKTIYDEKKVATCVDSYSAENKQISSGYIVVGFPTTTLLNDAKDIIQSHTLAPRVPVSGFHSYLYADVSSGNEFLWACRLKQDSRIRYADPSVVAQTQ